MMMTILLLLMMITMVVVEVVEDISSGVAWMVTARQDTGALVVAATATGDACACVVSRLAHHHEIGIRDTGNHSTTPADSDRMQEGSKDATSVARLSSCSSDRLFLMSLLGTRQTQHNRTTKSLDSFGIEFSFSVCASVCPSVRQTVYQPHGARCTF